jgi:hypothetical protein
MIEKPEFRDLFQSSVVFSLLQPIEEKPVSNGNSYVNAAYVASSSDVIDDAAPEKEDGEKKAEEEEEVDPWAVMDDESAFKPWSGGLHYSIFALGV